MLFNDSIIRGVLQFEYGDDAKIISKSYGKYSNFEIEGKDLTLHGHNDINIIAKKINLKNKYIISTESYGTEDPSTDNAVEGQVYFKIIE